MPLPSPVGTGLYTLAEAARLARVSPARVRGWIVGYRGRAAPILRRQYRDDGGPPVLGFLDLIEVRFVRALADRGVSRQSLRIAAERARAVIGHDHPFANARFRTDGRRIFLETRAETGDRRLLDLLADNFAIYDVLERSFRDGLDFDADGVARRWRPVAELDRIVVDPARAFGRPIDEASGVPADVLADALAAEGDVRRVADWYRVDPAAVTQAAALRSSLARAA
jgi:uncharacterized protein (DUF433 family)